MTMQVYHYVETQPITYRKGRPMKTGWYCENPGFLMGPFRTRAEAEGKPRKTPLAGVRADFMADARRAAE